MSEKRPPIVTKELTADHIRTRRTRMGMLEPRETNTTAIHKDRDGVRYQINYRWRNGQWRQFGRVIELGPSTDFAEPEPPPVDPVLKEIQRQLADLDAQEVED